MTCKACEARVKDWEGKDPKCGFETGAFNGKENWRCATVAQVRSLTKAVGRHYGTRTWSNQYEQTFMVIDTDYMVLVPTDDMDEPIEPEPIALWVNWNNGQGSVDAMWLMFENQPPRPPTEEECLKIIKYVQPPKYSTV